MFLNYKCFGQWFLKCNFPRTIHVMIIVCVCVSCRCPVFWTLVVFVLMLHSFWWLQSSTFIIQMCILSRTPYLKMAWSKKRKIIHIHSSFFIICLNNYPMQEARKKLNREKGNEYTWVGRSYTSHPMIQYNHFY